MSSFADFLRELFREGRVSFQERPTPNSNDEPEARSVLRAAFETHRLDVAGPLVEWDAPTSLAAAELVRRASWFLVNHDEPEAEVEQAIRMPAAPATPSQHLSADLLLRYLPVIHRRARAHAPDDRLTVLLSEVLRQWPLSGVLADVPEAPTTPLDFGEHHGLMLLYAERLAQNRKSEWVPQGRLLEYVEWVSNQPSPQRDRRP